MTYGPLWALQWGLDRLLSIGLHIEPRSRRTNAGTRYGPYLDLHLPGLVLSVGINPILAGELDLIRSYSRGGIRGERRPSG